MIKTWKSDYDLVDETILKDLDYTEVAPPEYHQFEALEDTVCYEFYFNHPIFEDIIRENRGFTKTNTKNEP